MSDLTYEKAGVSIKTGEKTVDNIKNIVKSTFVPGVMTGLGGFSGLFELKDYKNPVLVSGTDGVGTKLLVAINAGKFDTVGIDLVAMCVNDVIVNGSKPLFFLDYMALGKLEEKRFGEVINGIAEGCRQAECALIGGETAEMPGMYSEKDLDLAGFCVGAVEKDEIITGHEIKDGDLVLGLKSSGIHSNGYSLVRKLFFDKLNMDLESEFENTGKTVGEILLEPTKIYVKDLNRLKKNIKIKGMAHITGGGLCGNIKRILPEDVDVVLKKDSLPELEIFNFMKKHIDEEEMFNVFNMGIGFVIICDREAAEFAFNYLDCVKIGRVKSGKGEAFFE